MLQEGTCGLGFGVCGCNTTEQLMLILWWLTSRESSFIESILQTKISDNNPKWAILYHMWTRRFSLPASEQEDDSFREISVSDFPLPDMFPTGLSGVGHEEASFREYVCKAYRLLQCTWLHSLQKLKSDGNILFTAEIRWLLMVKRNADPGKKLQTQVGGKSKRHDSFSSTSDSSWGNSSPIGSFGASCKNTHIFIQWTCQLM